MKLVKTLLVYMLIMSVMMFNVVAEENATLETNVALCDKIMSLEGVGIGTELPSILPYGNERFNVYDSEEKLVGHIVTEGGKITSLDCTELEDPTYLVYLESDKVVDEILKADSPVDALKEKMDNGIRIEGQSFGKNVKVSVTKLILTVASWFM